MAEKFKSHFWVTNELDFLFYMNILLLLVQPRLTDHRLFNSEESYYTIL